LNHPYIVRKLIQSDLQPIILLKQHGFVAHRL